MTQRPLVATPSPALAARPAGAAPGFVDGVKCFFGGLGFLLKTPGAWPLALVPVVAVLVLGGGLSALAIHYVPPWAEGLVATANGGEFTIGGAFAAAFSVLVTIVAVAASFFGAFLLSIPISGPAFEALVRRQEADLGVPPRPETSFISDIGMALQSSLVGLLFAVPILVVLFLVSTFFPPAQVVTWPLKALVALVVLAWDLCDVPLGLRGIPVGRRIGILRKHLGAVIGMATGVLLLSLIPCGVLLAMPIGVLGAARLMFAIEQAEGPLR